MTTPVALEYFIDHSTAWIQFKAFTVTSAFSVTLAFAGIAFSQVGAFSARAVVRSHHWSHLMNTAMVSFTNVVCFAIFWVLKLLVFNRIFHFDKLRVIDEELVAEEVSAIPDPTPLDPIWTD